MTTRLLVRAFDVIEGALAVANAGHRAGAGTWKVDLGCDRLAVLSISWHDPWLCLDAPLRQDGKILRPSAKECSQWLERAAALPGPLKVVLKTSDESLHLAAEIELAEDDLDRAARLHNQAKIVHTIGCFRDTGSRLFRDQEVSSGCDGAGSGLSIESVGVVQQVWLVRDLARESKRSLFGW